MSTLTRLQPLDFDVVLLERVPICRGVRSSKRAALAWTQPHCSIAQIRRSRSEVGCAWREEGCDGSHYLPTDEFLAKDERFWFGA